MPPTKSPMKINKTNGGPGGRQAEMAARAAGPARLSPWNRVAFVYDNAEYGRRGKEEEKENKTKQADDRGQTKNLFEL